MSAPIGPGDWVETTAPSTTGLFEMGRPYLVAAVTPDDYCCDGCNQRHAGLLIAGIPSGHHPTRAWAICCFRPIYRPKAELIESLKVAARSVAPVIEREKSRETA